jgi:hypothetical protein
MSENKFLKSIDFSKAPDLKFLKRLTNQTGVIQHTKYSVPDRSLGYSVDDNARALLVAVLYDKLFKDESILDLAVIYLSFVHHAKTKDNLFYNFMSFDNKFLDHAKTEDGFGRVLWALGYTVFAKPRRDLTLGSKNLINDMEGKILEINSPRAIAYTISGLFYLAQAEEKESKWIQYIDQLTTKLTKLYSNNSGSNWKWFEPYMTYANGIFPYSLALAFVATNKKVYLDIAKESLEFLDEATTDKNVPSPIGQDGWLNKGKQKALFDQQPLEAADMVLAFIALYKIELAEEYLDKAKKWFSWYFGNNIKKVEVYDETTKGCFDGINENGLNLNQGAESILTYIMAYLDFSDLELKLGKKIS